MAEEPGQPITGLRTGDVSPHAFVCGDPARVERIAASWKGVREVCNLREYRVVVGDKDGVRLTAASTGIGAPSTANSGTCTSGGMPAKASGRRNGLNNAAMARPSKIHVALSSTMSTNPVRSPARIRWDSGALVAAVPGDAVTSGRGVRASIHPPTQYPTTMATTAAAITLATAKE